MSDFSVGVFFVLAALLPGCGEKCKTGFYWHEGLERCVVDDTCTDGDNMSNVRLADSMLGETNTGHATLGIAWDAGSGSGADLPRAYFDAVELEDPPTTVSDAYTTAERAIAIEFAVGAMSLSSTDPLPIELRFPDRRDFVDCTHPAMDDIYYLRMSFVFPGDGSIQSPTFEQEVSLGAF